MARPTDWSPLADSDPVPGDPQRIGQEAAHLSSVAQEIQGQVARLRAIATGHSVEKGLHVDKLKSASSDVADNLDKVVGRYQKTSAALGGWVPELEYAQSQSLKALAAAQDAAGRQRASQPVIRPSNYQPTPQDQQADKQRANVLNQANTDLAAARRMLDQATSYRDQKAGDTKNKIEDAIHDGVKDSWWDKFKSFIGHYAWLIQDICEGLEILATILAIVCLFIPGLDILDALLMVAFAATLLAAIGRGVLAATGNGSWLDFALDVLALVTFGASKYFSGALEVAAKGASETGQAALDADRAATAEEYVQKYFGSTVGRLIGEGRALEVASQFATEDIPDLALDAEKVGYLNSVWSAVKAGGSLDDFENFNKIATIAARYGANPDVASTLVNGTRALNALRVAGGLSMGGALSGLIGTGGQFNNAGGPVFRVNIPVISGAWDRVEEFTTTDGGLTTGQANAIVNAAQFTPLGPAATLFRWSLGGGW